MMTSRCGPHDPRALRELLSVLVPLVAEASAYDIVGPDGERIRVAVVHQRRSAEAALAASTVRADCATTVSVRVDGVAIGEVLVWRAGAMSAVEEALVVSTAERIADEIEKHAWRGSLADDPGVNHPAGVSFADPRSTL